MVIKRDQVFFVFDVESVGLHGPPFAVAGGLYQSGKRIVEFCFAAKVPDELKNILDPVDVEWVDKNVTEVVYNCDDLQEVRNRFWNMWEACKNAYSDVIMAADCCWPVETRFLSDCVRDDKDRNWRGPYPLLDISALLYSLGIDPLQSFERSESEKPAHNPLSDSRQSARLLHMAVDSICNRLGL